MVWIYTKYIFWRRIWYHFCWIEQYYDKKGQNGAMFIIMDEEASGAEKILQNALPLLRLFTHFDLSEAILEGKV